ncbi:hypothetical protein MPER_02776, partial [Moniliophthora perniciosa FA553]
MSSSEGENFDFQDDAYSDDSEDYAPAAKKTKAPAKPKSKAMTTKAKPAAARTAKGKGTSKKVLADHDDNAAEAETSGIMEIEDDVPSAAAPVAAANPGPTKKKTASETYTKLSQLEHILKRPDSYIGSVETITQTMWTYDADTKRMIVDEILVNAADNR